jgi:hypothetical protein
MKIDFYEEFPIEKNLKNLKLIDWPCRVFIAAGSVDKFKEFEKLAKKFNNKIDYAYWPIVKNSYWISPFSNNEDLIRLFNDLDSFDGHILIDLELPLKNRSMILENLSSFNENRKMIKSFLIKNKHRITTAQSPPVFGLGLRRFFGLDYNVGVDVGLMFYTSTLRQNNVYTLAVDRIKRLLKKINNKENYNIGLGTIAKGILTTEHILSPIDLDKDLKFVEKVGFKRVTIFRAGGLNKEYIKVIKKYI